MREIDDEPVTLTDNEVPVTYEDLPSPLAELADPFASEAPAEMQIFADIVGQKIDEHLKAHLGGIKEGIDGILAVVQQFGELKSTVEKQGREIADLKQDNADFKAWQKIVNERLGIEAAE